MSNTNSPSGFKVSKHARGGVSSRMSQYFIASALASNIFRGDGVIPVNTSKRIDVAAATNRLIGVFDGVNYVLANGDTQFRPYWATGTTLKTGTVAQANVYDDPDTLFEIQGSGVIADADVGALADITAAVAGNTLTGTSGQQLDSTTIASGTTLRIEEFVDRPDNTHGLANAKVLVRISLHYLSGALTAI